MMKICRLDIFFLLTLLLAVSCEVEPVGGGYEPGYGSGQDRVARIPAQETRNVLLLYSAGFNSLSRYLTDDIEDVMSGWLPGEGRNDDVLLIYSHLTKTIDNYADPNPPVLYRVYRDVEGIVVSDTLVRYAEDARSASAGQLHAVLSYVNEKFPARSYGMIFSSHATGYLPAGYYGAPADNDFDWDLMSYRFGHREYSPKPVPYVEPEYDPLRPVVKSIGQDLVGAYGSRVSYEMELSDFADALPMHLDYILFDSCLMGGVEVAYELRDKCGVVGFSPTEVLAEGLDYRTLTLSLLCEEPDPKAVCEDYYAQYASKEGNDRSATISLVDCGKLEGLADVCARLFEKYREELKNVSYNKVQRYYTYSYHWFYDLESIITEAGKVGQYTPEELSADIDDLHAALDECIIYKAATDSFLPSYGGFSIRTYSGLSMYLPCHGGPNLNEYYRTLAWNVRTGLVE